MRFKGAEESIATGMSTNWLLWMGSIDNQVEGNGYVIEQGRWSGSEYRGNYWNCWCSIKTGEFIMCNLFGFSIVSLKGKGHVTSLIQSVISNITKTEI